MTNEWSNLAIQEKFRINTLIFIFIGANKNLGQFGTLIRNGTQSYSKYKFQNAPVFKMLKPCVTKLLIDFHISVV
jgi:hypothetical protein